MTNIRNLSYMQSHKWNEQGKYLNKKGGQIRHFAVKRLFVMCKVPVYGM